jgi:hypothetical protein
MRSRCPAACRAPGNGRLQQVLLVILTAGVTRQNKSYMLGHGEDGLGIPRHWAAFEPDRPELRSCWGPGAGAVRSTPCQPAPGWLRQCRRTICTPALRGEAGGPIEWLVRTILGPAAIGTLTNRDGRQSEPSARPAGSQRPPAAATGGTRPLAHHLIHHSLAQGPPTATPHSTSGQTRSSQRQALPPVRSTGWTSGPPDQTRP